MKQLPIQPVKINKTKRIGYCPRCGEALHVRPGLYEDSPGTYGQYCWHCGYHVGLLDKTDCEICGERMYKYMKAKYCCDECRREAAHRQYLERSATIE